MSQLEATWPMTSTVDASLVARAGAAAALVGAAAVHSTVIEDHYAGWALAGTFFVALQVVETALAGAVVFFWSRLTAIAVGVTSVGTVTVWALSRTVGMPIGPPAFRVPEAVGVPDLVCGFLELSAAALLLPWALGRVGIHRARRHPVPAPTVWLAALAVLVALSVTALGAAEALRGEAGGHDHAGHAH